MEIDGARYSELDQLIQPTKFLFELLDRYPFVTEEM